MQDQYMIYYPKKDQIYLLRLRLRQIKINLLKNKRSKKLKVGRNNKQMKIKVQRKIKEVRNEKPKI